MYKATYICRRNKEEKGADGITRVTMTNQQTEKSDSVPNFIAGRTGNRIFQDATTFEVEEAIVMDIPVDTSGKVGPIHNLDTNGEKKYYIDVGLIFPKFGPKALETIIWCKQNKFKLTPIQLAKA